jgi:three-Cys-motif partner protein
MGCLTHSFMPKAELSNYKGREQAYVKHYLLERYLPDWGFKVGSKWEALVYVDGFAGPWETTDPNYADSSFAVAIDALRRCRLGLQGRGVDLSVSAVLVESHPEAFAKLDSYAKSTPEPEVSVTAIPGKFIDAIPQINQLVRTAGPRTFKFVLLDPKGWADIPMQQLQPFLKTRSCEVLITLMTKHINRFLREEDRAASYHNLFGRKGVLEALQNAVGDERTELAVKEYCKSLQILCGFRFVSSAVILEPEESQIRYFLVYATNHPRGVEVFKAAENKAAEVQEILRHQMYLERSGKVGQESLFNEGPPVSTYAFRLLRRYRDRARAKVLECLQKPSRATVTYESLFCEAMAFPLVTPDDLLGWLHDFDPYIELHPTEGHKKLSPSRADYITIIDRHGLQ